MAHLLTTMSSYCKHKLNELHLGNWSEYLIKINALSLHISLHDESCLVSDHVAIFISLQFENLFQSFGPVPLLKVY
jgi:hypothetical protein